MLAARFPKPDVATVERELPGGIAPVQTVAQVIANVAQSPCLDKVVPTLSNESAAATGPLGEVDKTHAMREVLSQVVHTAARSMGGADVGSGPLLEAITTAVADTLARTIHER